jgi:hypothetical protein
MIDSKYFKDYREKLGFTNQTVIKAFFSAKDVIPTVDFHYIDLLNARLVEIISKIHQVVTEEIKVKNIDIFIEENIKKVYEKLKSNNIISKLNNQGRRPEEVYFSWMRGYVISNYFINAISQIFELDKDSISIIGDDDIINIEAFKRSPRADLQLKFKNGDRLRIEVQSGFQGINDIKQHKVLEAKRILREEGVSSIVMHFDLYNGQVAFVKLDEIEDDSVNWITRQQMEGQTVFNIDQNYFLWKLTENPPLYKEILKK